MLKGSLGNINQMICCGLIQPIVASSSFLFCLSNYKWAKDKKRQKYWIKCDSSWGDIEGGRRDYAGGWWKFILIKKNSEVFLFLFSLKGNFFEENVNQVKVFNIECFQSTIKNLISHENVQSLASASGLSGCLILPRLCSHANAKRISSCSIHLHSFSQQIYEVNK